MEFPIAIIKIFIAILILIAGFGVGIFLSKLIKRILSEIKLDKVLKDLGIKFKLENLISTIVKYVVYMIALFLALNQFGFSNTLLYIILITILVIIISIIIISLKNFIPNLISGILISKKNIIKKGDNIKINGIEGKIKEFDILETKVETENKDIIFIPNSIITRKILHKKKSKK